MLQQLKKVGLFALIMACVLTLAACTGSNSEVSASGNENQVEDLSWSKIEEKNELVVGLCAAYPPFESRNEETGDLEGFDIDLATALGQALETPVKVEDAEWQALLGGLNKGDFDVLITCMSKKEAAVENVNMSDVYYNLNDVIVVREGYDAIQSKDDLKEKTVGVQLGSGSEQIVDKMEGLKEIKRYNYNPEAFIDLKHERLDAVVVGYAYAVNHIKKEGGFEVVDTPVESAEIVMVMRHGEDTLTEKVNEALQAVKENGAYDQAISKWLEVK